MHRVFQTRGPMVSSSHSIICCMGFDLLTIVFFLEFPDFHSCVHSSMLCVCWFFFSCVRQNFNSFCLKQIKNNNKFTNMAEWRVSALTYFVCFSFYVIFKTDSYYFIGIFLFWREAIRKLRRDERKKKNKDCFGTFRQSDEK